jgi:hypothetical protein
LVGGWHFQLKADDAGFYWLMEVSARPAGGQVHSRARGYNLPLLHVYLMQDNDLSLPAERDFPNLTKRLVPVSPILKNIKRAYFDLDDTLLVNQRVNPEAMALVYQMSGEEVDMKLITKHEFDVFETLRHFHIDPNLFSSIHHIKSNENKSTYISTDAGTTILIDNSFSERLEVSTNTNCQTFDVQDIIFLRDWRLS